MVTQTASQSVQIHTGERQQSTSLNSRLFKTRVVGVSFENRQEAIAKVKEGDFLWLEHELDNPFDCNAISVSRNNGESVGFLDKTLAFKLAPIFDSYRKPIRGYAYLLTGGSGDGYLLGLVVVFKLPHVGGIIKKERSRFLDWED